MSESDTLTIAEAAKVLGVHPNTVRSRIKTGLLPATKALTVNGEAYIISRAALTPLQDPLQNVGRVPGGSNELLSSNDAQSEGLVTLPTGLQGTLSVALQELIRPLIEENTRLYEKARDQAQELGRTQEQRDQARRDLAALQAQQTAAPASPSPELPSPSLPRSALGRILFTFARRVG